MKIKYEPGLKELARQLRNSGTKSEIKLWQYLKSRRFYGYDFHRQKPIDNYIADFFCNSLNLAIELDGYSHDFEKIISKDKIKEEKFKTLGIDVVRFQDEDVMKNIDGVLRTLEEFIKEKRGTHP